MSTYKNKSILKAYFDASPEISDTVVRAIIDTLNKHGCNVTQTVIGTEFMYQEPDKVGLENILKSKLNEIANVDVCVFEISYMSPTLLLLTYEALSKNKPVLLLCSEDSLSKMETFFQKPIASRLFIETYNLDSLHDKISRFLSEAKRKILTLRFTVRLSREHADILDTLKIKWGCSSKNEVVMKLLEDVMDFS